jgi:hypothetical protein
MYEVSRYLESHAKHPKYVCHRHPTHDRCLRFPEISGFARPVIPQTCLASAANFQTSAALRFTNVRGYTADMSGLSSKSSDLGNVVLDDMAAVPS